MIEIYGRTAPYCGFCVKAKTLCEKAGKPYKFYNLNRDWVTPELEKELGIEIKTVPVVLIDGKYLGGAAELAEYLK